MIFITKLKTSIQYTTRRGCLHNPYGPAVKWDDGNVSYHINDKQHNIVGPSCTGTEIAIHHINGIYVL